MMNQEDVYKRAAGLVNGMQKAGHPPYEAMSILVVALQITFRCIVFDKSDKADALAFFDSICAKAQADMKVALDQAKTEDGNDSSVH